MSENTNILYIGPEDLITIVDTIRTLPYPHKEEIPNYDLEPEAVDQYFSLIERIKSDTYYPDVYVKATVLFLNVNSHYFSNGNKRLAIFSLTYFLEANNAGVRNLSKETYGVLLKDIFKDAFPLEDYEGFQPTDFAMYNLALITARFNEAKVDFDAAKNQTERFLREMYF